MNIICDIGNVAILASHERTYKKLQQYGAPEEKAKQFFDTNAYRQFSKGKINAGTFVEQTNKELGIEIDFFDMLEAHDDHLYGINHQMITYINKLDKKHNILFATNTNPWQKERIKRIHPIDKMGEVYRSHVLKHLKTENEFWKRFLDRTGISKGLFIDDQIANLQCAKKHGLEGIRFYNYKLAKEEIDNYIRRNQ